MIRCKIEIMEDIFCKIAKNKADSVIIYQDKKVIAFLDIQPFSKGHALIIPRKHCVNLEEAPFDVLKEMFFVAASVSRYLRKNLKFDGTILVMNSGEKLQDTKHLHLHIYGKNIKEKELYFKKFKNRSHLIEDLKKTGARMKKALERNKK